MSWPFEAIHVFQLANGNVLAFDGWQQPEPTYVWNPTTQASPRPTAPDSIFCSGMAQLPNGEVMTVGGYGGLTTGQIGIVDTAIFNPATGTWTRSRTCTRRAGTRMSPSSPTATMSPSAATRPTPTLGRHARNLQPHGQHLDRADESLDFPDPRGGVSVLLPGPNGEVFTIGPSEDSPTSSTCQPDLDAVGGSSGVINGSSVMYRPGKILYSGGAPSVIQHDRLRRHHGAIDLTAATPKWQQIAPMHNDRVYHTLTMLADGDRAGGRRRGDQRPEKSSRAACCRRKSGTPRPKRGRRRRRSPPRATTTPRRC